jgi:hypothetical protein
MAAAYEVVKCGCDWLQNETSPQAAGVPILGATIVILHNVV